jgi:hypothetical protein
MLWTGVFSILSRTPLFMSEMGFGQQPVKTASSKPINAQERKKSDGFAGGKKG